MSEQVIALHFLLTVLGGSQDLFQDGLAPAFVWAHELAGCLLVNLPFVPAFLLLMPIKIPTTY